MNLPEMHLVLHGTAIKKHGTAEAIASVAGLDAGRVEALLLEASESGRVVNVGGKYMLTPAAQMALKGEYSRYYSSIRKSKDFMDAYDQFELINDELKALITRWQTMPVGGEQVANDHSDPDYDAAIIDELGELHERVESVLERLGSHLPRINVYGNKLLAALEKAEDGDHQWVSDAPIESYHTVWFEMHEDLLRVTGQNRRE